MSLAVPALVSLAYLLLILNPRVPLYVLLGLDLLLVVVPSQWGWQLAGIRFDVTDLGVFWLVTAYFYRGRAEQRLRLRDIPYFWTWLLLGILMSVAYVSQPANQHLITDPVRVVYQLYRYCWRAILYYPFVAHLLRERKHVRIGLWLIIGAGVLAALSGFSQGLAGREAHGPFNAGNALGAALVVPILFSLTLFLHARVGRVRWIALACLAILARATLWSSSRGAQIATVAAAMLVCWWSLFRPETRTRLLRYAIAAPAVVLLLFIAKPDLLDRPTIRHALSSSDGSQDSNFRWRMEQRWPYFWNLATSHPWLGSGDLVIEEFGRAANTPHNAYLAIAVKRGFPVLGLYLLFAFRTLLNARLLRKRSKDPTDVLVALACGAGLAGMLIHGIVESNLHDEFQSKLLWGTAALTAVCAARIRTDERRAARVNREQAAAGLRASESRSGRLSAVPSLGRAAAGRGD